MYILVLSDYQDASFLPLSSHQSTHAVVPVAIPPSLEPVEQADTLVRHALSTDPRHLSRLAAVVILRLCVCLCLTMPVSRCASGRCAQVRLRRNQAAPTRMLAPVELPVLLCQDEVCWGTRMDYVLAGAPKSAARDEAAQPASLLFTSLDALDPLDLPLTSFPA